MSGPSDKTIHTWSSSSGQQFYTLRGHTGTVWAVALSPHENRIASGSDNKIVRVWSLNTGELLATLKGH